jgi:hypothetical protein
MNVSRSKEELVLVFDLEDVLLISHCICHFPSSQGGNIRYGINNNYFLKTFSKKTIYNSQIFFNYLIQTPKDFCKQAKHIRGPRKSFYISLRSSNRFLQRYNIILELEQWTNMSQEFTVSNEPIGNKEVRQVIWQRTPINIISPSDPLTRRQVCPHPPNQRRGGHTLLRLRGVPIRTTGEKAQH